MKKLIFRNLIKYPDFFIIMCLAFGTIVWTLQAVNYFDYVSQDGHGLKTYLPYTAQFSKIIHRIIPFIFLFLFYILNEYENKNELQIFGLLELVNLTLQIKF